jgi:hypothetical protein
MDGDLIFLLVLCSILYFMIGMGAYAVSADGVGWFRYAGGFWNQFKDWQKAYNRRVSCDKNSSMYPEYRREEHYEAKYLMQKLGGALVVPFWPLVLVFAIAYGLFKAVKAASVLFSNLFKIIDSLKGE